MFTDNFFSQKKVSHVVQRGRRPIPEQLAPSHPKEDGWEEKSATGGFLVRLPNQPRPRWFLPKNNCARLTCAGAVPTRCIHLSRLLSGERVVMEEGGGEHWAVVIKSVFLESMLYLCLNSLRSAMFLLQGVCLCLYLCVSLSVCLSV